LTLVVAWLTMQFIASVGLWCSVRTNSSWRSLLLTVFLSSVGGFVLTAISVPIGAVTAILMWLLSESIDKIVGDISPGLLNTNEIAETLRPLGFALGIALMYWWVARSLIFAPEQYLAICAGLPTVRAGLCDLSGE